ncbi:RAP domain-containing protein [Endozoicomonas acroporae]|uniref:RAP domain-containing protein n=1 Tax=Endozoicomonas acroporae TaxID=1701104 RepID=UPI003D7B3CF2
MDRGGAGISWKYTTSGNDYKQPESHGDSSRDRRYRHRTARQANTPPPYIPGRNESYRASGACSADYPPRYSVKPVDDFNTLVTQEKMDWLAKVSAHYGKNYDGKKHSQFTTLIKQYTLASQRPLNHSEQRQLIPLLHDFKATPRWSWRSLTTTFHSFTSAGVFTPHKYMDAWVKETQAALLSNLLDLVILKCNQETRDIDALGAVNLMWALAKLVDNGLVLKKTPKLKEAVAALLPYAKIKAESKEENDHFIPKRIASLLWSVAKLVDNGLELKKTPKLQEAVATLLHQVKTRAESKEKKDHFNAQGNANLMWAVAKLVDNGLELEKTPLLKKAVAVILHNVTTNARLKEERDHLIPQHITNLLWAVAKLVDNGLEKTLKLKEAVVALLPHVKTTAESKEEKDHFNTQTATNLLWALAKLVDHGLKLENTPKLKEVVAVLLSHVKAKAESKEEKDHFTPQEVANLYWAVAKLVDHGLELEKTPKLKEAVAALLLHIKAKAKSNEEKEYFISQHISNMMWALAKLVDNGLELEKTPELKEVVAVLLPHVATKAESREERDRFIPQHIANLLWALAKLVDNGLELEKTPTVKAALAALLYHVKTKAKSKEEKDHFIPQQITNLLWAMAKLVDNGLELEKTPKLKEAVAALLPRVKTKAQAKEGKSQFQPQEVSNLLWALAKLVDNGLALERTPTLKEVVVRLLLPHVKTNAESKENKDCFCNQDIVNLLWAVAKLVHNGLELERTPKLKEVVAALLIHVTTKAGSIAEKDQFSSQNIANLLWALAKLVEKGLTLGKTSKLKEPVIALLPHVQTKAEAKEDKDHLKPREVANLLWALAKMGEAIELNLVQTAINSLVDRITENPQLSQRDIPMSLWGVLVFCARFYLHFGSDGKNALEKRIDELLSRLEIPPPCNTEAPFIMAMAASWLGRACPVVVPYYRSTISQSQSIFRDQLRLSLPSLKIEEETSLNSLPPVDLLLPDYHLVIDIQGPFHYVGGDFKTRNGPTLLKIALLQKLGFEVIEIPVTKLDDRDSMQSVIEQIKTKLAILPEADGPVLLSSEKTVDDVYITADEEGQFSDDCYFSAEEDLSS